MDGVYQVDCPACDEPEAIEVTLATEHGHGANYDGDLGTTETFGEITKQSCPCPLDRRQIAAVIDAAG